MEATIEAVGVPIRTVCAWCQGVMVDVPEDGRGISHGIHGECGRKQVAEWRAGRTSEIGR